MASVPAAVMLAVVIGVRADAQQTAVPAQSPEFFEASVRPILVAACYECHTDAANGALRLDSLDAMLTGGESGPAIVPGDPDASLLIQAVKHADPNAPRMPKGKSKLKPRR